MSLFKKNLRQNLGFKNGLAPMNLLIDTIAGVYIWGIVHHLNLKKCLNA